jgi:hypothetical protein
MTISNDSDLERLREIGGIVARVLDAMRRGAVIVTAPR